jgi:cold shock protein
MIGTIKALMTDRGYGFIRSSECDYFFHMTSVTGSDFYELNINDSVDFDLAPSPKGPRAQNVRVMR